MSRHKEDQVTNEKERSLRLKQYEKVYNRLSLGKVENQTEKKVVKEKTKEKVKPKEKTKSNKESLKLGTKTLNDYQLFVKEESKKEKYKNIKASERLSMIATAWETYKKRKKNVSQK